MTKDDIKAIAASLRRVRESYGTNWNPNLFRACDDHAREVGQLLFRELPGFNQAAFLSLCGYGTKGKSGANEEVIVYAK
jgi:hypothetical protein